MFLAIDIGNSSIKFGLFKDNAICKKFSIPTKENLSVKKLTAKWEHFIGSRNEHIDSVLISSVVPEANEFVAGLCRSVFNIEPDFITPEMFGSLQSKYDPPFSAGHDRLVNIFAAIKKYGRPVIVCSFGTATTIDAADAEGTYLGGIIAPGMFTMAESLNAKASQLPRVEIRPTSKVIGNSTESAILSGIYYGHAGLAEKLIDRISAELLPAADLEDNLETESKPLIVVVATGGLAPMVAPVINNIDIVDENLMLEGLNFLKTH